jgi:hypothetical protein
LAYFLVFELQQFVKLTGSLGEAILLQANFRTKAKENHVDVFLKLKAKQVVEDLKMNSRIRLRK